MYRVIDTIGFLVWAGLLGIGLLTMLTGMDISRRAHDCNVAYPDSWGYCEALVEHCDSMEDCDYSTFWRREMRERELRLRGVFPT